MPKIKLNSCADYNPAWKPRNESRLEDKRESSAGGIEFDLGINNNFNDYG